MDKRKIFNKKTDKEVPESKGLAPDMSRIKETICGVCEIGEKDLLVAKRGTENEPRNVAYLPDEVSKKVNHC
jgi:hypothetical protein